LRSIGRFARADGMESALVRWVVCAVLLCAVASSAAAQEFGPPLRGPEPITQPSTPHWGGFYFGGQTGYSSADADFSRSTQSLLAYSLRGLTLEADADPSSEPILGHGGADAAGYGGFVGYNVQWQEAILGLEVNYTHSPFTATASNSAFLDRIYAIGSNSLTSVTEQGTGSLEITDYASLRLRAGWTFGNNFLPYAFGGLAVGRGSYSLTTLVYGQQSSPVSPATPLLPCTPSPGTCLDYSFSNSASGNDIFMYGYSVGAGVDVALATNLFLRGEFEYVAFPEVQGISVNIATARIGVGLKF
jgi:opacity protein-like surface antigen